jgi:hypothetical protein
MQGSSPHLSENRWLWRGLAAGLILASAALHIAYLIHNCPLDLAADEAHYWDWSRHLDWSYYSKGPLVALLIRAGCELFGSLSESLTGNIALAVRMPAIGCGMLLLTSLYVLTARVTGRERPAFALVAFALTLPPVAAVSTLMTIDSPYTACWGWALVLGYEAAVRERRWAWPLAGVVVGIGILAKYTMVLWLPSIMLFLLTSAEGRRQLRQPGFWIACVIAAFFALPILIWNAQHDWVTFRHVGVQAGVDHSKGIRWIGPIAFVAGQAGILLAVWFVAWVAAMWANRPWRTPDAGRRYLWWLSAPSFAVFFAVSFKTPVQVNWPAAAYISGGVLIAVWLSDLTLTISDERTARRWRAARLAGAFAAVLGVAVTLAVHFPAVGRPLILALAGRPTADHPFPIRQIDPTCRLRGWRMLAAAVDEARATVRKSGEEPIVAGTIWNLPAPVAAYAEGHPSVYTIGLAFGDRLCQYDMWRPSPVWDPDEFRGRTFVLVGYLSNNVYDAFDEVGPTRLVTYVEGDQPVTTWHVTIARGYRGFGPVEPFLDLGRR